MLSYYNVSYIQSGNSDDLLAMLIRTTADCIGEEHLPPPQEPFDWRAAAKILCQEQTLLEKIYTNVPTDRKQAFKTTVYNSVAYHCYAVSALLAVQSALVEFRNANSPRALGNLSEAMSFLDAIDELHHDVEGIRFAGLFAYDDLTCQPAARRAVQSAISRLQSTIGVANFGWATGVDLTKCRGYSYMYNYQFDFARQHYPTQFATPDQNMFNWPQVYCDYIDSAATKDGSWCIPNPTGASFHLNATITIKTAGGIPVRYTMDGSAPGPSSPIASGTITLTESTTIIAQAIDAAQPPTVAIFEISS